MKPKRLMFLWSSFFVSTFSSNRRVMATFAAGSPQLIRDSATQTITVLPADPSKQSATVVLMHGLGDSAEGFSGVAETIAQQLPYVKFILPTAPTQPVSLNGGMAMPSWYDIVGLEERSNEICEGILESQNTIRSILEKEHAETLLPYSRMALAGFSQGGALSLYTGLQLPVEQKLAGLVVMSGYLAGAQQFALTSGLESVPVLHCHGTGDPMVRFDMAQKTEARLKELGASNYTLKPYPGMQHTVIPSEIGDVLKFLHTILPPDTTCEIQPRDPSSMSVRELKATIKAAGLERQAVGLMEKNELVKLLQENQKVTG